MHTEQNKVGQPMGNVQGSATAVRPTLPAAGAAAGRAGRRRRHGRIPAPVAQRPSGLRRGWAALTPHRRLAVLITALGLAAAAVFLGVVVHLPSTSPPLRLPWPVWALAFAVGEGLVTHVQVRRESHSFSLTDLVLAAALCLMHPAALVSAQVTGCAVALLLQRRQFNVKLAFNLAQFGLAGCLASTVFTVLTRGAPWSSPWDWIAALAAVTVASLSAALATWAAITLSEGSGSIRELRPLLALWLPFALGSATVGLLLVRLSVLDPTALLLLALPTGLLIAAYRAYTHARRQQDNLRLLHEVTSLLYDSADATEGLSNFLTAVRSAFRAGLSELILLDEGGTTISRSREGQDTVVLLPLQDSDDAAVLLGAADATGSLTSRTGDSQNRHLDDYVARRGLKDAVVSVLRTQQRVYGLLLVGNRLGEVSTFTGADVALLETFARHVATSVERGRLQSDLRHVTDLQEKLRHQALHDALTGLPNRSLFLDRARTAVQLGNRTGTWPAVLYLDLDGFKPINDSYGHEAGDRVLQVFAQRLAGCLRAADTAARLGGDEFAVLINGPIDADGLDRVIGRIRDQLALAIPLGDGRHATVGASIGTAIAGAGRVDVDLLLREADTAMYAAKHARDNRYVRER